MPGRDLAREGLEPYGDLEDRGRSHHISHVIVGTTVADVVDSALGAAMCRAVLEMVT